MKKPPYDQDAEVEGFHLTPGQELTLRNALKSKTRKRPRKEYLPDDRLRNQYE